MVHRYGENGNEWLSAPNFIAREVINTPPLDTRVANYESQGAATLNVRPNGDCEINELLVNHRHLRNSAPQSLNDSLTLGRTPSQ